MQNKANVKIGKISISTAILTAYVNKQRTMNNERCSKQTQSKPISPPHRDEIRDTKTVPPRYATRNTRYAIRNTNQIKANFKRANTLPSLPAERLPRRCAPRNDEFEWISVPGSALRYVSPLASLGRNDAGLEHPPFGGGCHQDDAARKRIWFFQVVLFGSIQRRRGR